MSLFRLGFMKMLLSRVVLELAGCKELFCSKTCLISDWKDLSYFMEMVLIGMYI